MKELILSIMIIFFSGIFVSYSQRSEATIKFKNGAKIQGYGKLISKNRIAFRETLDQKAIKYNFSECEYFEVRLWDDKIRYVQLPVKGKVHPVIVKEQIVGTLSLYTTSVSGYAPTSGNFGTAAGMSPGLGISYSIDNYYLKQNSSDSLIHMGSNQLFSGKFKIKAASFFKNCPSLAYKIKNRKKGFRKRNMEEIVKYYNLKCK